MDVIIKEWQEKLEDVDADVEFLNKEIERLDARRLDLQRNGEGIQDVVYAQLLLNSTKNYLEQLQQNISSLSTIYN